MLFNIGSTFTGGNLIVTAPAGVTVSVTKDAVTKTVTADSNGIATFKGLTTGTWTVTITDGTQTTSRIVKVITDYDMTIEFFATIAVTYPEGSVCTCSDGETTLTAVDRTGSYTFTVPNAGVWTLTSSNETFTKSEIVEVTTEGQNSSIELMYRWYLYNTDDTCEELTGGWAGKSYAFNFGDGSSSPAASSYSTPSITYNTGSMRVAMSGTAGTSAIGSAVINNTIDLTPYSKLYFDVADSNVASSPRIYVGVTETMKPVYTFTKYKQIADTGLYEVDVSELSGEYTIAIGLLTYTILGYVTFNSIYLE